MFKRVSYAVVCSAMAYVAQAKANGVASAATNKSYAQAVKACEDYKSRGHGGKKKAHQFTGIARARRAARKARNRAA